MNVRILKSSAAGFLMGYGLATLLMQLLTYYGFHYFTARGIPLGDISLNMHASSYIQKLMFLIVTIPSEVFAGYIAARGARLRPYLSAAITSLMIYSLLAMKWIMWADATPSPAPFWAQNLAYIVPFPACLLGAFIASKICDRQGSAALNKPVQPTADAPAD